MCLSTELRSASLEIVFFFFFMKSATENMRKAEEAYRKHL